MEVFLPSQGVFEDAGNGMLLLTGQFLFGVGPATKLDFRDLFVSPTT